MYWVEYYCPKQSPYWQRGNQPFSDMKVAMLEAQMIKPPMGLARVVNMYGQELYQC